METGLNRNGRPAARQGSRGTSVGRTNLLTVAKAGVTVVNARDGLHASCHSYRRAKCAMRFAGISRGFVLSILWSAVGRRPDLADGRANRGRAARADHARALPGHGGSRADPQGHAGRAQRRADPLDRSRLGAVVRESEEIAQLDRTEASARLKMATAELHEKQALLKIEQELLRKSTRRRSRLPRRESSWPSSSSTAARCGHRSRAAWSRCRCAPVNMC